MGLSSLPAPSEGMLCVILVNTAFSISVFKGLIRTILDLIGFRLFLRSPSSADSSDANQTFQHRTSPSDTYMDLFRNQTRTIRFDMLCQCRNRAALDDCEREHVCSVCLTEFTPESEINVLSCGHVFHRLCLEKWLVYWNITCPLCRAPFLPEGEAPSCYQA